MEPTSSAISSSSPKSKDYSEKSFVKDKAFRLKAAIFLSSVTGLSILMGFGATLAAAKRKDPAFFNKGLLPTRELPISGSALAMKALGYGTVYAFAGCGILFYTIWKISGAENLQDFRMKAGSILPKVPKNDPPQSRLEFEGLTDLLKYVSEEKKTETK